MATVQRFGPGEQARNFTPGDFILAHRNRPIGALIMMAQERRFRGADSPFAHWTHAAVVVGADGELVEAESMGVRRSPVTKYRDSEYHLVRLGADFGEADRARSVDYANGQVGQAFGYLDLAGAGLYLLFGLPMRWMRGNHQICSGLVVRALQHGGQATQLDPELTLPGDLAKLYGAKP